MLPDEPLVLPLRPSPQPPAAFPVLVTVAPLAAAAVIWFVTGSAFALIFAVLSPVIAVAGMADARRTQRKRAAADRDGYQEGLRALRVSVTERHDELRRTLRLRTPSVRSILAEPTGAGRWRGTKGTSVSLGTGVVSSDVRLSGTAEIGEHRELRLWAASLTDAPVLADAGGGIGIIGQGALTRALGRGVVVQLCFALAPTELMLDGVPGSDWGWTEGLPHTLPHRSHALTVTECRRPSGPAATTSPGFSGVHLRVLIAERPEDLPPGLATVVRVEGPHRAVVVTSPVYSSGLEFHPELVSAEEAARFAAEAQEQASAAGLLARGCPVPRTLAFSELRRPVFGGNAAGATAGLACIVGRGESGELGVDLVRDGPHAVVGGTTGSGKSELLVTWVTSLAGTYSPAQVTFLLVDFKGGVAFRPLCTLPHCVGLITDLDASAAERTLASLSAELHYRERILAAAQAADVADARVVRGETPLPRLVIVVDEFATMLNAFPQLHALFVDVAARGRSLGVHLILCTQRPAGVVRDALLANCSLRVSLRVNNAADSQAVIGTDAAAGLTADLPGRCLIMVASGQPRLCQVASTTEADIHAVADAASRPHIGGGAFVRRPWLDPLPPVVTCNDVAAVHARSDDPHGDGDGFVLGLLDEPDQQRYRVGRWDPLTEGNLLVVGGARTGKTTLLRSLRNQSGAAQSGAAQSGAAQSGAAECSSAQIGLARPIAVWSEFVPADVEGTWDALTRACRLLDAPWRPPGEHHLLLLDDVDSVCARWDTEHRLEALDMLASLLRDGAAAQMTVVVCVQRLAGVLQNLTSTCQNVLLLRLSNAAEHQAAGGLSAHFNPALPPGGGHWRGLRVQLLSPDVGAPLDVPSALYPTAPCLDRESPLLVVTRSAGGAGSPWRAARGGPTRVIDLTGRAALSGGRPTGGSGGGGRDHHHRRRRGLADPVGTAGRAAHPCHARLRGQQPGGLPRHLAPPGASAPARCRPRPRLGGAARRYGLEGVTSRRTGDLSHPRMSATSRWSRPWALATGALTSMPAWVLRPRASGVFARSACFQPRLAIDSTYGRVALVSA
ncbi:hypothetical protein JF66_01295 [Cryobacterium sp. MLB-32]|nr:hypothetical protein JF66_01295 [Cryobacterium sp. MLB-32]